KWSPAVARAVELGRPSASLLVHLVDHRVEGRIVLLDTGDRLFDQLRRRYVAMGDQLCQTEAVVVGVLAQPHSLSSVQPNGFPASYAVWSHSVKRVPESPAS